MKCSSGTNGGFGLDVLTFKTYVIPFCYNKQLKQFISYKAFSNAMQ